MAKKKTNQQKSTNKSPNPPAVSPASFPAWLGWAPTVLAALLFSVGLNNELLGVDDHAATVNNPAVTQLDFLGRFNLGMFAPVTWLGYSIAYGIGQNNAVWYHLLSLIVHAVNARLIYLLMLRWQGRQGIAFWVAVLFAVHPVQVESVAWIAGFSTPLFTLFCLVSLWFYDDHAATPGGNIGKYSLALSAFLVACLAKSTAVTLPLVMLVLDQYWKKPALSVRQRWLGYAPFFALALAFGLFTFYTRQASGVAVGVSGSGFTLLDRFFLVCYAPLFYWAKLLVPVNLSIYYSFSKANGVLPVLYYISPLVLGALGWLAWRYREQAPYWRKGLLFYMAAISVSLPLYSVGTFELCADHYNYLPSVGIFYIVCSLLVAWSGKEREAGALHMVGAIWSVILIFMSVVQIGLWKNTISIVSHAIDKGYHQQGMMYEARAKAYGSDKKLQAAIQDFNKALEINPSLWESYKYRGGLYGAAKQYEKSVADLSKYLEQFPNDAEILYNRGLSLHNLGRNHEAIADFSKTLALNPEFARAHRARGNVYQVIGEPEKAAADMEAWERLSGEGNGR